MKEMKFYIAIMVMIGSIIFSSGTQATEAKVEVDLITLAEKINDENMIINGWSLHAREKLVVKDQKEIEKYVDSLQQKFPDWKWGTKVDQNHWEARAVQFKENRKESLTILSTLTNEQRDAYILYEVQSKEMNESHKEFLKNDLSKKLSDIFRGNATIFSCIKGQFNDNMKTSLPNTVNYLLKAYKAEEIEGLKEESFISISAFSPLFEKSISTSSQEINLQIGLRNEGLGSVTTFVVGTPIITIEY
ncbi:YwmB family TATA-box binding protein [Bacillus massilinigeriensis]|uniref:YwmB family TATA-box binding protein n=1 Tax=Bacillus massilionigeriensis TaxID=1805475 RepID=UPI00096AE0F3|nr:YwmB family TATA-box binding protein [Bacillus massilionigeriensis]